MSPFDRAHTTPYWRCIVTVALSRVVSEIFNVERCRDLKFRVRGHSSHWKWYYSIDWVRFLLYSNFVLKPRRFWDSRLQKCRDIENRVMGLSRSLEMSPFDRAHMTSYWRSIVIWLYLLSFLRYSMSNNDVTLKSGSKVTQGHWMLYHAIECVWFPISVL